MFWADVLDALEVLMTPAKRPAPKKPAAKDSAAKSSAAKSSAAKSSAAKGSAAKGSAAKSSAAKGSAAKSSAAKSSAAKNLAAKNSVAKKSAAKKPAARNPAAKNPAAKTTAAKNPAAKKVAANLPGKQPGGAKSAVAMPAKSSSASKLAERLAGVAIPADAWALSRVKPGVSVSPHVDQLLALGWPNMIAVVDEPWTPTDAKKALRSFDLHRIVPREMLPRLFAYHHEWDSYKRAAAFEAEPKPFELASVVDDAIYDHGWNAILALEGMFGAEPVATAFVAAIVKTTDSEEWDRVSDTVIRGLGVILDRTPAATRDRLRATLEAHYTALGEESYANATEALDVILHGRKAVEERAKLPDGRHYPSELHWARDDAAWVEKIALAEAPTWKGRDRNWFDAQLAFVGGPKVLSALRTSLANGGVFAEHKKAVTEQLALFP